VLHVLLASISPKRLAIRPAIALTGNDLSQYLDVLQAHKVQDFGNLNYAFLLISRIPLLEPSIHNTLTSMILTLWE
jgi:hypothetical protein